MFGSTNLEAMLRNALEGLDDNFGNVFEKTIPLWKKKLSTGSYMLNLHVICPILCK